MHKQPLWNFGSTWFSVGFRFELPDSSRIEYTRDYCQDDELGELEQLRHCEGKIIYSKVTSLNM